MNLYLLTQDDREDYDTYDSVVVCAESEADAVTIYPNNYGTSWNTSEYRSWALTPDLVEAEYLGQAHDNLKRGVVLASFNAG
jgi:hypothetical protein